MLIRSKNKMHIVNIENGVVSAEGDGTLTFRAGKIRVVLGEYSSAQKAFKYRAYKPFTYKELKVKTYDQLRTEVIQ